MAEETKIGIKIEEEAKPLKKLCEKLEESIGAEFNKGIEQIDVTEMKEAIDMLKDLYYAKEKMVKGCYYKYIMEAMEKEEEKGDDGEEMEDDGRRGYRGQPRDSTGRYTSRRGRRGRRGYEEPMMFDEDWEEMERMRDMDRPEGKMYYSGSGSSGGISGGSKGGSIGGLQGGGSRGYSDGGNRGYSEGRQSEGGNYSSRSQDGGRDSREGRSGQSRRSYMETKEMNTENTAEAKQMKMKELERYMTELGTDVTEMIAGASPEEKSLLKAKLSTLAQKVV